MLTALTKQARLDGSGKIWQNTDQRYTSVLGTTRLVSSLALEVMLAGKHGGVEVKK